MVKVSPLLSLLRCSLSLELVMLCVLSLVTCQTGFHNVAGHANAENYLSWEWEDAHLTDFGWKQVQAPHPPSKQARDCAKNYFTHIQSAFDAVLACLYICSSMLGPEQGILRLQSVNLLQQGFRGQHLPLTVSCAYM